MIKFHFHVFLIAELLEAKDYPLKPRKGSRDNLLVLPGTQRLPDTWMRLFFTGWRSEDLMVPQI